MSTTELPLTLDAVSSSGGSKRISPARTAVAVAVGAWAALFWFVLLSGRISLYLGTRTNWVVPAGAVILTAAFIGRALSLRVTDPEPIQRRDAVGLSVLILPVVLLLALPPSSLGSYAVGRRSGVASAFASTAGAAIPEHGDISMVSVASALADRETMKVMVQRAGSIVSFTGFISRQSDEPATEFLLNRFVITCCVADAIDTQVRVANAPPGEFKPDQWVRVTGKLYPLGREVIVDASAVTGVARPRHPYLNP